MESLDVGAFGQHADLTATSPLATVRAEPDDFAVLAALPKLRHLRLDATAKHRKGVSLHLPKLHSITWVCGAPSRAQSMADAAV